MTNELTQRQKKVLDYITRQVDGAGMPPTIREIGAQFSISIGTVQGYLRALEKKGVIKKAKERARGLMISARKSIGAKIRLPILGRVAAGNPLEAISDIEDYLSVDEHIAKQANFVLRVKGDSMMPEMREGDLVLVKTAKTADSGDVIIAYLEDDGEATVKRLRKRGAHAYLEPANPKYSPIMDKPFSVVGKVTSLIRTFA